MESRFDLVNCLVRVVLFRASLLKHVKAYTIICKGGGTKWKQTIKDGGKREGRDGERRRRVTRDPLSFLPPLTVFVRSWIAEPDKQYTTGLGGNALPPDSLPGRLKHTTMYSTHTFRHKQCQMEAEGALFLFCSSSRLLSLHRSCYRNIQTAKQESKIRSNREKQHRKLQ